jgi:hypothetical protein
MVSAVTIVIILVSAAALSALELWLFWTLGERDEHRRR